MEIVYIIVGIAVGFVIGWLISKQNATGSIRKVENGLHELDKERSVLQSRNENLEKENAEIQKELLEEKELREHLNSELIKIEASNKNLLEKLETQKQELEEVRIQFAKEFELIANKVLKQNSMEFTQLNQKNIGELLNPLKEKIQTFEKQVAESYDKELRDKISLKEEVKKLYDLNQRISQEANSLTKALKGDTKQQGNWGELVLERILEESGLTRGREYDLQYRTTNQQGNIIQPDVVVKLPDNKHLIIDAKVSLVAYERFTESEDKSEAEKHLKEHIASLLTHIKQLHEKHYQSGTGLNTPDMVLMFVPIESSFAAAVKQDKQLFTAAWEKKIVIVSPTTLLATLYTISSIWRQENQTKNAMEIARQSGLLHDKFVNFIKDLENIGKHIEQTNKSWDAAMNKLKDGRGNLVISAKKIQDLGAKTNKNIPDIYLLKEGEE